MIKTVIFDFDGVIHDTMELAYNINDRISSKGISLDEYKDYFNGNLYSSKKMDHSKRDEFFKLQDEEFRLLKIEEKIKEELLKLKSKYDLHIITSNKESTLKTYFHNNNLHDLFTEILGIETHKSKEEKFNILLDKYNLKKEECIFVTDTLGAILEANAVGIKSIAVTFGFHERERLEKGNPWKIIDEFEEIEKII